MREAERGLPEIYLRPGEMIVVRNPTVLATILGSCVGVTFWCLRLRIGALCHAILPRFPKNPVEHSAALKFRYVDSCIQNLARQFDSLGASRAEVEVKVFGGAEVAVTRDFDARPSVGRLNAETAMQVLHEEGYAVVATSLGNKYGRKIKFNTGSGEVQLVRLI